MVRKTFVILTAVALSLYVLPVHVAASTYGYAKQTRNYASLYARCSGDAGEFDEYLWDDATPPDPAHVDTTSGAECGTAYISGSMTVAGGPSPAPQTMTGYVHPGAQEGSSASGDKLLPLPDSLRSVEMTPCTLSVNTGTNEATLHLHGSMEAVPTSYSRLVVKIHQNDDTSQVLFTGTVTLRPFNPLEVTGFDPLDFNISTVGDTTRVTFDFSHDPISYTAPDETVGWQMWLDAGYDRIPAPSLTPYGLLVLLALLILSGIIVIRRRRQGVVAR